MTEAISLRLPVAIREQIEAHYAKVQARTPLVPVSMTSVLLNLLAAGLSAEKGAARG